VIFNNYSQVKSQALRPIPSAGAHPTHASSVRRRFIAATRTGYGPKFSPPSFIQNLCCRDIRDVNNRWNFTTTTEWLEFEHERGRDQEMLPVQHDLNMYPTIRGWHMQQVWDNGDLRQAHPSLQDEHLSPYAVGRRLASMLQSWLYFGPLEATIGRTRHPRF